MIKKLFNIFRRNWLKFDVEFDKNICSIIEIKFCRNMEKIPLIFKVFSHNIRILFKYYNSKHTIILTEERRKKNRCLLIRYKLFRICRIICHKNEEFYSIISSVSKKEI